VSLDALRDSEYGQVEHQANVFAANLLMPLDDYRRQIEAQAKVDLDMIGHCADRYRVSLIAAVLRWLGYTERRATTAETTLRDVQEAARAVGLQIHRRERVCRPLRRRHLSLMIWTRRFSLQRAT
jgi:Zn-dependent peptidase ImmA (M78 family)